MRAGGGTIRVRRVAVAAVSIALPVCLVIWGGHWGVHVARNLLFPGAGLVDHYWWLAVLCAAAGIAATFLWLSWGAGWAVLMVVIASSVLSGALAGSGHAGGVEAVGGEPERVALAHEFPLVILVVAGLVWLRSTVTRLPLVRRLVEHRRSQRGGTGSLAVLGAVDRARTIVLRALAGEETVDVEGESTWEAIRTRARRVSLISRGRLGDPLRRDHAYARCAGLALGQLGIEEARRLGHEVSESSIGAPCSEPSWIRPLDATLTALVLQERGHPDPAARWEEALQSRFALRRGHRPAAWWTPLDLGAGAAPAWEHAAFTALARAAGWISDDDWAALRSRALGAAARGARQPHDARLVAAARIWLVFVDDAEAHRVIHRPGVQRDALAVALDGLASGLCENRDALRAVVRGTDGGEAST